MNNNKKLLALAVIGSLLSAPAIARQDSDDRGYDKSRYEEHYKEWHQMNIDMMGILKRTMTILRDINHHPSDKEKAELSQMINQMDDLMQRHSKMGDMDRDRRNMMDNDRGMMGDDWGRRGDRD